MFLIILPLELDSPCLFEYGLSTAEADSIMDRQPRLMNIKRRYSINLNSIKPNKMIAESANFRTSTNSPIPTDSPA